MSTKQTIYQHPLSLLCIALLQDDALICLFLQLYSIHGKLCSLMSDIHIGACQLNFFHDLSRSPALRTAIIPPMPILPLLIGCEKQVPVVSVLG